MVAGGGGEKKNRLTMADTNTEVNKMQDKFVPGRKAVVENGP